MDPINNSGINVTQNVEMTEQKKNFNTALEVFNKIDKKQPSTSKAVVKINTTTSSTALSNSNTIIDTPPIKPPKPQETLSTTATTEEKTKQVVQTSSALFSAIAYAGYMVFGTTLSGKQYEDEIEYLKKQLIHDSLYFSNSVSNQFRDNEDLALFALQRNHHNFPMVSPRLKSDQNFLLNAVKRNGLVTYYLKTTKDTALEAVKQNPAAFLYIDKLHRKDPEIIKATFSSIYAEEYLTSDGSPSWFKDLPQDFTTDKQAALLATKEYGKVIFALSVNLKVDAEIQIAAIERGADISYFTTLQNNPTVATVALKRNGLWLEHMQPIVRRDPTAVLAALRQNGLALEHADEPMKDDKKYVIPAVKQNGHAIRHASERLRNDPEVKAACKF